MAIITPLDLMQEGMIQGNILQNIYSCFHMDKKEKMCSGVIDWQLELLDEQTNENLVIFVCNKHLTSFLKKSNYTVYHIDNSHLLKLEYDVEELRKETLEDLETHQTEERYGEIVDYNEAFSDGMSYGADIAESYLMNYAGQEIGRYLFDMVENLRDESAIIMQGGADKMYCDEYTQLNQ